MTLERHHDNEHSRNTRWSLKETRLLLNKTEDFFDENPDKIYINISRHVKVYVYKGHLAFFIGNKYIKPYDGNKYPIIVKKYKTRCLGENAFCRLMGKEIIVSESTRERLLLEYLEDNQPLDEIKWIHSLKKKC